jgi:Domain of Unknown Function (DUF928)
MIDLIRPAQLAILAVFVELCLAPCLPTRAQVTSEARRHMSDTPLESLREHILFEENFEPPGDGQPDDTSSAGSRTGLKCEQDEDKQAIHAIMPSRNYGLTLEERPPIFVDLADTSAQQVVLILQDELGEDYQRAFLPIVDRGGITSFTLPDDKSAPIAGKNYQWSLVIVCGDTVQPDDPVLHGWVQRVEVSPEQERELAQKSEVDRISWLAQHGYWYDAIAEIDRARTLTPGNVQLENFWNNVLELAGIEAAEPETF